MAQALAAVLALYAAGGAFLAFVLGEVYVGAACVLVAAALGWYASEFR